ncbi:MAG: hypothetical protein C4291_12320 [Candidatus Dadabacteria bacterium]
MEWREGFFATRDQELLLQAALLEGSDAIEAWEKWKSITDFEGHMDRGSFRLLPLLYKNLQHHGVRDPLMNRLKGVYRLVWYENQKLFYDMSEILRYLHNAGIKTMVLKGTALTLLYYKNYGVRPMADIDILVPTSQASSAIDLLRKAGWMSTTKSIEKDLRYRHSTEFKNQSGKEFDLHWHLLFESCREDSDRDFWEGSVPTAVCGVSTSALNPVDTLLHIIIHGVRWNPEPSIRWIADAMTVINYSDLEIDWRRLIEQAKTHRVGLRLKRALNYLKDKFQARIPSSVMAEVNDIPVSPVERFEYRYIMNSQENALLGGFPLYLIEYLRLTNGTGLLPSVVEFPKFFQYRFNARNLRQLLFLILSAGIRRTNKKLLSKMITDGTKS